MKYILFALPLCTVNVLANTKTCPDCPKSYATSKMEEFLSTQYKQQRLQTKLSNNNKKQKTPVETVKSHTDKLKKTRNDTYISKIREKINPPANQFCEHIKQLEQSAHYSNRRKN